MTEQQPDEMVGVATVAAPAILEFPLPLGNRKIGVRVSAICAYVTTDNPSSVTLVLDSGHEFSVTASFAQMRSLLTGGV